jgi:hypothetical protein
MTVKEIRFPNNVICSEKSCFRVGIDCDEIKRIFKNGEMAKICWFEIVKNGKVISEIKESICDIFYV